MSICSAIVKQNVSIKIKQILKNCNKYKQIAINASKQLSKYELLPISLHVRENTK